MEDYFLLKNISHAVIGLLLGIIIAFTTLVYIILHIYVPGYSIIIPTIIMIVGITLTIWSGYRIAVIGRHNEI